MERFVADVHLGKLARTLRLLGFDTVYENFHTKDDLKRIALEEHRVLLSRDKSIGKNIAALRTYTVESDNSFEQLKSLVQSYQLQNSFHPFNRCLVCNGVLEAIAKENVLPQLLPQTIRFFDEFWQCQNCHRVYWKGSHYDRMLGLIQRLKTELS